MTSLPWFKMYTEIIDEPKLASLSEAQKWRFVQLLALAGECGEDGYLTSSGMPLAVEEMAWRLRVQAGRLKADLAALARRRLLVFDEGSQSWLVPSFAKRQQHPQEVKRTQWREQKRRQRQKMEEEMVAVESTAAIESIAKASINLHGEATDLEDNVLGDLEEGTDGHVRLKNRIEQDQARPRLTEDQNREEGVFVRGRKEGGGLHPEEWTG